MRGRKLLLATGLRDQPLAIYGRGDHKGGGLALELTLWSRDLVLCTDGPSELSDHYRARLAHYGLRHGFGRHLLHKKAESCRREG